MAGVAAPVTAVRSGVFLLGLGYGRRARSEVAQIGLVTGHIAASGDMNFMIAIGLRVIVYVVIGHQTHLSSVGLMLRMDDECRRRKACLVQTGRNSRDVAKCVSAV